MHSQTFMADQAVQRVVALRRFRAVLGFFIFALIVSGITAFPLQRELVAVAAARGTMRAIAPRRWAGLPDTAAGGPA